MAERGRPSITMSKGKGSCRFSIIRHTVRRSGLDNPQPTSMIRVTAWLQLEDGTWPLEWAIACKLAAHLHIYDGVVDMEVRRGLTRSIQDGDWMCVTTDWHVMPQHH